MVTHRQRKLLSRRRARRVVATAGKPQPPTQFLNSLALRKPTLAVAAIQASIKSPDHADALMARAENLETVLSLLGKVQTYGGHKDICLFPVLPLPSGADAVLVQAARRYNCTLVYGSEGLSRDGHIVRLTTTIPPNGDIRLAHAPLENASVLVLRTRNGIYRVVACAADAWYPGQAGLTTAIHSPDGRAIVSTRSRGEQAVAAVLHVGEAPAIPS